MTLTTKYGQKDSTIHSEKTLHRDFFEIRRFAVSFRQFDGTWTPTIQRDLFVRGNTVAVVLYDPKREKVILLEQFRIGAHDMPQGPWLFEIVAGMMEAGESPDAVAKRETLEEAGCQIERLIPIYRFLTSPGGTDECVNLYCGLVDSENVGGVHGVADEYEDILVHVLTLAEALAMMEDGRICNALAIIALQWLALKRTTLSF